MRHTTLRVPDDDYNALERSAGINGRTTAQEVRLAIRHYLNWLTGTAAAQAKTNRKGRDGRRS